MGPAATTRAHLGLPQPRLTAFLRGAWSVRRRVNVAQMTFEGTARFDDDPGTPGGLTWDERGRLRNGSHVAAARRAYLIVPALGGWEVRFEDGRPFHRLQLAGGRGAAEHLCGADVYRGVYELTGPDAFTVTWRVTGPRKDDLIESDYRRVRAGATSARPARRAARA